MNSTTATKNTTSRYDAAKAEPSPFFNFWFQFIGYSFIDKVTHTKKTKTEIWHRDKVYATQLAQHMAKYETLNNMPNCKYKLHINENYVGDKELIIN